MVQGLLASCACSPRRPTRDSGHLRGLLRVRTGVWGLRETPQRPQIVPCREDGCPHPSRVPFRPASARGLTGERLGGTGFRGERSPTSPLAEPTRMSSTSCSPTETTLISTRSWLSGSASTTTTVHTELTREERLFGRLPLEVPAAECGEADPVRFESAGYGGLCQRSFQPVICFAA